MSKLIVKLDASSLSESSCILRFHRTCISGYRSKTTSPSLVYGSSVHKFADTMFKTDGNLPLSITAALAVFNGATPNETKSAFLRDEHHLQATCFYFWNDFIAKDSSFHVLKQADGSPATEITFSLPYYEDDFIKVYLEGTIDSVGKITGGCYCIRDFKTTSTFNVKNHLAAFKLSKQLRFYLMVVRMMATIAPDSVLGQIGATRVGARIDGIFLREKPVENKYVSSEVFQYPNEELDEFQHTVDDFIRKLSSSVKTGWVPHEGITNGGCHTEFDCKFCDVCSAPFNVQQLLLDRDFRKAPYEPLKFGEQL